MPQTKHELRETAKDKKNEEIILNVCAWYFGKMAGIEGLDFQQVMTHGKYKIDGWLHSGNTLHSWIECKWLTKAGFYGINFSKYIEGKKLAEESGLPFLYAFSVPSESGRKFGFFVVHDGAGDGCDKRLVRCGGTPRDRPANWDDIEPMMMFQNYEQITWMGTRKAN